MKNQNSYWRRLLPTLVLFLAQTLFGQGIIYVHAPLSNSDGNPNQLPWDSQGTQVGSDYSIVIDGQTVMTLYCPQANGQPSAFDASASASSAMIAYQPYLNPLDDTSFVVPLSAGQSIGPDAAGYNWLSGGLFTASTGSGSMENPFLSVGYFTGLESAYMGFSFQQAGQTYYGWVRVGCPISGLNVGWVYDYAYETAPNTSILAGQTTCTPIKISPVSHSSYVRLDWPCAVGNTFQVQYKEQLDATNWSNMDFALTATGTNTTINLPTKSSACFYRVVQIKLGE